MSSLNEFLEKQAANRYNEGACGICTHPIAKEELRKALEGLRERHLRSTINSLLDYLKAACKEQGAPLHKSYRTLRRCVNRCHNDLWADVRVQS